MQKRAKVAPTFNLMVRLFCFALGCVVLCWLLGCRLIETRPFQQHDKPAIHQKERLTDATRFLLCFSVFDRDAPL